MPFTAGIYYGGSMAMNNYILKIYMLTNSVDPASQNIAFERLKYFVYSEINGTIFINRENDEQCQLLAKAGLKITMLPGEPVDQLVGMMLYSKLNAIMENYMIIHETEISSDLGDSMTYLHCADENLGPFTESGWWNAADLVHYDIDLIDSDKVVSMHRAGAWRELDLAWPDLKNDEPIDNTVVFADFDRDDTK
jgi:hypothetical protein